MSESSKIYFYLTKTVLKGNCKCRAVELATFGAFFKNDPLVQQ